MTDNDDCKYEFCTSSLVPPGMEDLCGAPGCGNDSTGGSFIETCVVHETYLIVPLCADHHDFAADTLHAITEIVQFAGLLTEGSE